MRNFATQYEAVRYAQQMGAAIECTIDGGAIHHVYANGDAYCGGAVCVCVCDQTRRAVLAAQVAAQIANEGCTILFG